ncbi:MAG: outer membrane protein transport protein [Candidatus Latescibacterota bacterium]|nr:MAG: outer membrane protein transport protein [Candidatus Latescibacterota bacterium]
MKVRLEVALILLVLVGMSAPAFSAGFAIIEQSVPGLGNAFAGQAAIAQDATTVYFNPAGLTWLEGHQVTAAVHTVIPQADFTNEGSTHILQPATTQPLAGADDGGGKAGFIPNLYYSLTLENGMAFGLGINAPFALTTEYERDWVGRYHAVESELHSLNINPCVAYRVHEKLSIGAGFSAQWMNAQLSNAIDFGTLDASGAFDPFPPFGLTPQADDGFAELDGDSWGFGFNVGVIFEPMEDSRIGVAYRSRISHDVEGNVEFTTPPELAPVWAATGFFTDTDATTTVDFPDDISVSAYHRFNPQWAVMADVKWTHWALFEELRFKFKPPPGFDEDQHQPDGVTTESWEDSWRFSAGGTFEPNEQLILRTGLAYDQTPIPDPRHRTPRIPGEDRYWITLGAGYKISEMFSADIGYAYLFVSDPVIDKSDFAATDALREDRIRGGLKGTYSASVNIISAQVSFYF